MFRVYAILGVIGAAVMAAWVFFQKGVTAGRDSITAVINKKSMDQQKKAHIAMIKGLAKEDEVRNEKVDTDNRDHFTRQ